MNQGTGAGPPLAAFAAAPASLEERLDVDEATGTVNLGVPLPFATDRGGTTPPVKLVYTGGGNGPVGLGWSLSAPSVQRVGDRGASRFDESDRYVITGVGEVSPKLVRDGADWMRAMRRVGGMHVVSHTPVVGDPTHIIEQWVDHATGLSQWRVEGPDGSVAVYGESERARVADPHQPARIFTWYIDRSWDAVGNGFTYSYKPENDTGVDLGHPAEAARWRRGGVSGTHLKRIRYGNRLPYDPDDPAADVEFRLEVVFDYGEHDPADPATAADETRPWNVRPDPFSWYPTFEARSYRRCRRVLFFNRYPALSAAEQHTGSLEFTYGPDDENRAGSRLRSITRVGHRGERGGWIRSTAPLTLEYREPAVDDAPRRLRDDGGAPFVSGEMPEWIDLFGEGVVHAMYRRNGSWRFRPNRGGGVFGGELELDELPSAAHVGVGSLGDVHANGTRDLLVATPEVSGWHALDAPDRRWAPMVELDFTPRVGGVAVGVIDTTGAGTGDALIGSGYDTVWIESARSAGHRSPVRRVGPDDGPPVLHADLDRGIHVADMTGSGLADIVQITNGSVTFWPNLSGGAFGSAVVVPDAPRFDHHDRFDPRRVRLVDLHGSGTPDLLYLGPDGASVWKNLAANGFGPKQRLSGVPPLGTNSTVDLCDLEADGSTCLVWTRDPGSGVSRDIEYVRLTRDGVPGRLESYRNGIGAEVHITTASTAAMYLDAQQRERPWPVPLTAHPPVVTEIRRVDHITATSSTERFEYHDPVVDPDDASFRSFGYTERRDTPGPRAPPLPGEPRTPEALVRSFHHPGERELTHASTHAGLAPTRVDASRVGRADVGETAPTLRAAYRALAGRLVRREVCAADDPDHPFQVSSSRFEVRPRQLVAGDGAARLGSTSVVELETVIEVREQTIDDPRVEHTVHLDVDDFGRVGRVATIGYGRRADRAVHPDQAETHVLVEERAVADLPGLPVVSIGARSGRYLGIDLERRRHEVRLDPIPGRVTLEELDLALDAAFAAPVPFTTDLATVAAPAARLVEWERTSYLDGAGNPTRDPNAVALPVRMAAVDGAALPDDLVAELPAEIDASELGVLGYVFDAAHWWRPGTRQTYGPADDFYQLLTVTDGLGAVESFERDDEHRCVRAVIDAVGLRTEYEIDYVTLEPTRRIDPNGTIAEVRFDPLRRVRARSVRGRTRRDDGAVRVAGDESLQNHDLRAAATLADVVADPSAFVQGAAAAAHYADRAWHDHLAAGGDVASAPPCTVTVVTRTQHQRVDPTAPIEMVVSHHDGAGRPAQHKRRVSAGPAFRRAAVGVEQADVADRWLCTGRTTHDDKGLVDQTYEPLHTEGPGFESAMLLAAVGDATRFVRDPMGRPVRTDVPGGFHTEAVRMPWSIVTYDENDTIERSQARLARISGGEIVDPDTIAAIESATAHADTPTIMHLDALGRPFLTETTDRIGPSATIHHGYDAGGLTRSLTDARGVVATFRRDMQAVTVAEHTGDAGTHQMLTDVMQRVVHRWDPRGVQLRNRFDGAGRLIEVRSVSDGAPTALERYRYGDDLPGAADRNQRGRLVEVEDQVGTQHIARYDHEGRALDVDRRFSVEYRASLDWSAAPALEGDSYRTSRTYDALGRLTQVVRPDNTVQHTTYRNGGVRSVRLTTADGGVDETFLADVELDARGRRSGEVLGNGATTALTFDEQGRLASHHTTRGGVDLAEVHYRRDPVGNVTWRNNASRQHLIANLPAVPAELRPDRFVYDSRYRLIEATGWTHEALHAQSSTGGGVPQPFQGTHHISLNNGQLVQPYRRRYQYDLSGNLQELRHTSAAGNFTREYWVSPTSNRSTLRDRPDGSLRPDPAASFDAAGNMVEFDHLRSVDHDERGRIRRAVVIERAAPVVDDAEYYGYAADGTRSRKVTERLDHGRPMVIDVRYIDGYRLTVRTHGDDRIFERSTSEARHEERRFGLVHRWALDTRGLEVAAAGVTAIRHQISIDGDHAHLVIDEQGGVVSYEEYTPLGETSFVAGDNARDLLSDRDRWAGKERDDATGFYAFAHRAYAPWLGRFVTPDPTRLADGPNLYLFVHANPVTNRDPLGLQTDKKRQREEMKRLMARAVDFESLPADVQAQARGGWLTASERGGSVYVFAPGQPLRYEGPETLNAAVDAGAIAIRTIPRARAELERSLDEIRSGPATIDTLSAPFPDDFATEGFGPVGATGPKTPVDDAPASSPDVPTPSGVSISAVGKGAKLLPEKARVPDAVQPAAKVSGDLPDDVVRWGDSDAARKDLLSRPEFQDGKVPKDFGRDVPAGVRPDQIDPHGPPVGEYGHVAKHGDHHSKTDPKKKADYDAAGNRITEREHGTAKGHIKEVGAEPVGGSQYTDSHYRNDVTVYTERETALNKTLENRGGSGADNPTTDRMKAATRAGESHDFAGTFEHARDNYHRAIDATNSQVPKRAADIGVFHQMSNASGMNTTAETAAKLPAGAADDIDDLTAKMDATDAHIWGQADPPKVPDTPNPGRATKALGAAKAGGKVVLEALGPLGTGVSVYTYATAKTKSDKILAGADLAADVVGYAGPLGATFSVSYGVTRAVDEGIGWASKEYLGVDLAPTSVMADGMVSVDQTVSKLWADPSKPAYTQTLGWKLAEWFDL